MYKKSHVFKCIFKPILTQNVIVETEVKYILISKVVEVFFLEYCFLFMF